MTKTEARTLLVKMARENLGAVFVNGKWLFKCDVREMAR